MKIRYLLYVVPFLLMGVFTHAEAGGHGGGGFNHGGGGLGRFDHGRFGRGGFFSDVEIGVGDPYYYPYYDYYGYSPAPYYQGSAYYGNHSSARESLAIQVQRQLSLQG